MKKLISCLLAVLLVCSLMSMSVFAAGNDYPAGGKVSGAGDYDVIGTHGNNGTVIDGADSFDSGNLGADIKVNFDVSVNNNNTGANGGNNGNNTLIHKYAIDITYANLVFDLTRTSTTLTNINNGNNGTYENEPLYQVWNVNTYEYDLCVKKVKDDGTETYIPVVIGDTTDNRGTEEVIEATEDEVTAGSLTVEDAFYVTNHSDLDVNYAAALTNGNSDVIKFTFVSNTDGTSVEGTSVEETETVSIAATTISKVASGADEATTSTKWDLKVDPSTDSWTDAINKFQPAAGTSTTTVATITITVKPGAVA